VWTGYRFGGALSPQSGRRNESMGGVKSGVDWAHNGAVAGVVDLVATLALVLAASVVTWWTVGDLSYTGPSSLGPYRDHLVQPLTISSGAETLIGISSSVVVVAACAVLLRPGSAPRRDRRWLAVLLPLLAAAVFLGWGWRVLTAGVVGANIGGGLLEIVGGPLVVAVVVWSLAASRWLLIHRPPHHP